MEKESDAVGKGFIISQAPVPTFTARDRSYASVCYPVRDDGVTGWARSDLLSW